MNKTAAEILYDKLYCMSVGDALWLLALYGSLEERLWMNNMWIHVYNLDKYLYDDEFAIDVQVRFLGGPNKAWYWGNLLTFAIDRVLTGNVNGIGFGWLLRYDAEHGETMCGQLGRYVPAVLQASPLTVNDREYGDLDIPFDYDDDDRVMEYMTVNGKSYAVHESGKVVPGTLSAAGSTASGDRIYKWSSSGRTGVSH